MGMDRIYFEKVWAWELIDINSSLATVLDLGEGIFIRYGEKNGQTTAIIELQYGEIINIPVTQFRFLSEWIDC